MDEIEFKNGRIDIKTPNGDKLIITAGVNGKVTIHSLGGHRFVESMQNRTDGHSSIVLTEIRKLK